MKNELMAGYITDLMLYIGMKLRGESVAGTELAQRLLEARVVMEKMRPIETRLQYQIEKLLRAGEMKSSKDLAGKDPLSFRPNLDALVAHNEGDDEDDDDDDEFTKSSSKDKSKVYRAPRLAAVPYEEDDKSKAREEREERRQTDRMRRSEVVDAIRDEFGDRPEMVDGSRMDVMTSSKARRLREEALERERWEEEHFTRLTVNKKTRNAMRTEERKSMGFTSIADIGKASDVSGFNKRRRGEGGASEAGGGANKRRVGAIAAATSAVGKKYKRRRK